ncbi:MAG: hypothetical protein WDN50_06495 [Bradyrhizobium sp.]
MALHGDLLALRGERRPLIAYYIRANILSASEMTKVNPAAGLYAPLAGGGLCQRAGWHDHGIMTGQPRCSASSRSAEIDAVAQSLDDRLLTFLKKAGS